MVCRSDNSPNRMSLDKHSLLMERTHLSAKAFRFGLRAGSKSGWTPPERSVARKEAQNLLSRSCSAKANRAQDAIDVVDRIACHLRHPMFGRMSSSDSSDGDSSRLQVQKEQDIVSLQSVPSEHFDGKEINARQDSHVGANEVSPVHLLSTFGSRCDAEAS